MCICIYAYTCIYPCACIRDLGAPRNSQRVAQVLSLELRYVIDKRAMLYMSGNHRICTHIISQARQNYTQETITDPSPHSPGNHLAYEFLASSAIFLARPAHV